LLPKYRGPAPIQRPLLAGETESGVSIIWMAEAMDAGDLLLQEREPILPEDNAGTLEARLAEKSAALLARALDLIREGEAPRVPQDRSQVTYAKLFREEEMEIDWTKPSQEIVNLVRALSPKPGARTWLRGERLKILRASPEKNLSGERGRPGEIAEIGKREPLAWAGEGALRIEEVQPAGKKGMAGPDFARGRKLVPGEAFVSGGEAGPSRE